MPEDNSTILQPPQAIPEPSEPAADADEPEFLRDIDREQAAAARFGLQQAYLDDTTPDDAAKQIKTARQFGVDPSLASTITPQEKAAAEAEHVRWLGERYAQTVFARRMGSLSFANLVKDDADNTGFLESARRWIAGDGGEVTWFGKNIRNSVARGLYNVENTAPAFGHTARLIDLRRQLDYIKEIDEGIAAGKSNRELFPDAPDADGMRYLYDRTTAADRERLRREIRDHVEAQLRIDTIVSVYKHAAVMDRVSKAKSIGEAVVAALQNPIDFILDVGFESGVEMAPGLLGTVLTGGAGAPVALPMLMTGIYSAGMDRSASLLEEMQKLGIDTMDPEARYKFFTEDPRFGEALRKAEAHAGPVGALDAFSFGTAHLGFPKVFPRLLSGRVAPSVERAYSSWFSSPYRRTLTNIGGQALWQGTLGGTGEALGQINTEGKITDPGNIVAEFGGEFFSSPIEVASATYGAVRRAQRVKQRAAADQEAIKNIIDAAQQSKVIPRDPETVREMLDEADADEPVVICVDVDSLSQEATPAPAGQAPEGQASGKPSLLDGLLAVSKSAREQIAEARRTGGVIRIPYSEFVVDVATSPIAQELAPLLHTASGVTQIEADAVVDEVVSGASAFVSNAVAMEPGMMDSLAAVRNTIQGELDQMPDMTDTEKAASLRLLTHHVANMAKDSGMTPEEIWSEFGATAFLTEEDVERTPDGMIIAKSERAKRLLAGQAGAGSLAQEATPGAEATTTEPASQEAAGEKSAAKPKKPTKKQIAKAFQASVDAAKGMVRQAVSMAEQVTTDTHKPQAAQARQLAEQAQALVDKAVAARPDDLKQREAEDKQRKKDAAKYKRAKDKAEEKGLPIPPEPPETPLSPMQSDQTLAEAVELARKARQAAEQTLRTEQIELARAKRSTLTGAFIARCIPKESIAAVRKKYQGTKQWMKAPDGTPTKLTEEQWLAVRTPEFKGWFGDWEAHPEAMKRIVEPNGEPKVAPAVDPSQLTPAQIRERSELDEQAGADPRPADEILDEMNQALADFVNEEAARRKVDPAEIWKALGELRTTVSAEFSEKLSFRVRGAKQIVYQKTIASLVKEAAKKAGIDLSDQKSPAVKAFLTQVAIDDTLYSLETKPSAIGWYDEKVRKCLGVAALLFPELDPDGPQFDANKLFAFLYVTAVTSNGLRVSQNLPFAVDIYKDYRATGVMPVRATGTQQEGIKAALEAWPQVQARFAGLDDMRKFFMTQWTVKQLSLMGFDAKGEPVDETVRGAAMIGPKIGNGFFADLNGAFDALTMDRWFMRTTGRWDGTLIELNEPLFRESVAEFRAQLEKWKDNEALVKYLKETVKWDLNDALAATETVEEMIAKEKELTAESTPLVTLAKKLHQALFSKKSRQDFEKAMGKEADDLRLAAVAVSRNAAHDVVSPGTGGNRQYKRGFMRPALTVLRSFEGNGTLTMADTQAVLWYAEKRIYENTKSSDDVVEDYDEEEAPDYATAMRDKALAEGVSKDKIDAVFERVDKEIQDEKDGTRKAAGDRFDSIGAGDQLQFFGTLGFGALRSDRRLSVENNKKQGERSATVYRAKRKVAAAGVRPADGGSAGGVSALDEGTTKRGGRKVSSVLTPIATWKAGSAVSAILKAWQTIRGRAEESAAPSFQEFAPTVEAAEAFLDALKAAKKGMGAIGACVEEKSVAELTGQDADKSQCRIFLTEDRQSGFVIKNGNDLVSVFSAKGVNSGDAIVECAIAAGARRLDCFNTILPKFYAKHGFKPVARLKFDRNFAPYDWDYKFFQKGGFNNGEPDIVFMVYDNGFNGFGWDDMLRKAPYTTGMAYGEPHVSDAVKAAAENNKAVAAAVGGGVLNQNNSQFVDPNQGILGSFLRDPRIIIRWAGANESTFLHETGHLFLDMRVALAQRLKARGNLTEEQARFVKVTEDTLAWLGTDLDTFTSLTTDEARDMHEKFARTYEQYLYEGNAPTKGLQGLFHTFSRWLMRCYRAFAAVPGAEQMSDSVRALFDALFVSASEAKAAELRRGIFNALELVRQARSDEEKADADEKLMAAYTAAFDDFDDETTAEFRTKWMGDLAYLRSLRGRVSARLAKRAEGMRDQLEDEELERLKKDPVYSTIALLTKGRDGRRAKLLVSMLEEAGIPDDQIAALTEAGMTVTRRVAAAVTDGDAFAQSIGFGSLEEMVTKITSAEPIEKAAQDAADERMLQEHAELSSPEAIDKAADDAVFNPSLTRLLAAEINMLEKNEKAVSESFFRQIARVFIGRQRIRDVSATEARNASTKLRREAMKTLRGGRRRVNRPDGSISYETAEPDLRGGLRQLRMSLYQAALAVESKRMKEALERKIKRMQERFGRRAEVSGMSAQSLAQVQRFLGMFGIAPELRPESAIDYEDWVADLAEKGVAAPAFTADIGQLAGDDIRDLTVDDATAVLDFIDDVVAAARYAETIEVNGKRYAIEEIRGRVAEAVGKAADERNRKPVNLVEDSGWRSKASHILRRIGLAHARIPSLLAAMENGRFSGPLWEFVVRRADECDGREQQLSSRLTRRLWEVQKPLGAKLRSNKRRYYAAIGASLTDAELVAVAMNLGNAENVQRLIDGSHKYPQTEVGEDGQRAKWSYEGILQVIGERFSREELQAIQDSWDVFGSLWDDVVALERRQGNRLPKKVQPSAVTFTLANGETMTLKGGYYPIAYDREANDLASIQEDSKAALDMFRGAMGQAATSRGHTQTRLTRLNDRPVTLTNRAGYEGLAKVIHDLCWREWVADANKIFAPGGAAAEAIRLYWGSESMKAIRDWVARIAANGDIAGKSFSDEIANLVRSGVSFAGLGFNWVTALIQPLGLTQSIAVVGGKWIVRGLAEFVSSPVASIRMVAARSPIMAGRMNTRFRELAELQREMSMNRRPVRDMLMRLGYGPIMICQMFVDFPTWLGAYNKALSEGVTEDEAVARADRSVVDSQGSGVLKDLSEIETRNPWTKLFTVFYTFFNTAYNLLWLSGKTKGVAKLAFDIALVAILQQGLETFLREGLAAAVSDADDDDDEWAKKTAMKALGNIAGFGAGLFVPTREIQEAVAAFAGGETVRSYGGPSGTRKLADSAKFIGQVGQVIWSDNPSEQLDEALLKSAVNVAGEWFGFPVVPVNRAISGAAALSRGDTENYGTLILGYRKY